MSDESETEEIADLSSPDVTTKYRTCSDIVNQALKAVVEACVDEADIVTLCELGDGIINEETGKLYNKKDKSGRKIQKGVAFPTCISVNDIVGNFSPLKGESRQLKAGDVVKVDLGAHIDGFITSAAHTLVVGGDKVEDRRADVIMAAWNAAEAAARLVRVGNKNTAVTAAFTKIASEFNCKPIQGVLSHQLKKHVIEGSRVIASVESLEEKVEEFEFELNEVYCINVVMSTGDGRPKQADVRNTVYKRAVQTSYGLKTQKARQFISEVHKKFPTLPFTLRAIEDEQVARIGVSESKRHELLDEYPVMKEKDREFVAQFKFTVLLLPSGAKRVTGLPLGNLEQQVVSSLSVQDEQLKKLLASSATAKKRNRKPKESKDGKDGKDGKEEKEGED